MAVGINSNYWLETVTPLGNAGVFTSATRDAYGAGGSSFLPATTSQWAYASFVLFADQTGTALLQGSQNPSGGPWYTVAGTASNIVANTPLYLYSPVCFQFWQVVVTNGSTPQTKLNLNFAFTSV